MNISFLTSGHDPFDDRIFYHMARSLADHNNNVLIISSKTDLVKVEDGINLHCFDGEDLPKREKIDKFVGILSANDPDILICSEPLPVLAANKYRSLSDKKIRIVYDITEWYPSKKNLSSHNYFARCFIFIKLALFNLWVTRYTDSFIFGEWFKSRPYRLLFLRKPYAFISYFPDLKYITNIESHIGKDTLRLSYSGKISLEKGFGNFMIVIKELLKINKLLKIKIKVIGEYHNDTDRAECKQYLDSIHPNISIQFIERQSFINFAENINDTDIFLDLRRIDFENHRCLPIKLFYYAALGRPVIFSDLKAIRKEVETKTFGFLVNPDDNKTIVKIITEYLENRELYSLHCKNARNLVESKYNWKIIEPLFLKFLSVK